MSQARCTATTKHGAACKSWALPNRVTCISHAEDLRAKVEAARRQGGTAAARLRLLTGRRLKLDSAAALLRFNADLAQDTLSGTVDPGVSRAVSYAIANQLRLLETSDLERRLAALEAAQQQGGNRRWG